MRLAHADRPVRGGTGLGERPPGLHPLLVRNLEHSQRQHAALVEAVLDGDADGAREMMREHCGGTAALLRGFLA